MIIVPPDNFGPLSDATLVSFAWEHGGRDVALQLILGGGIARQYVFTWVDHLSIDITQRDKGPSQPLAWNGAAKKLPNGRLRVLLDFAGQGSVSLECNEIVADDA